MIGKIITGSSFRGLVNYLLDPSKTPEIISTNLAGTDRNMMIWELNACAEQRPTTKKPVKHISIGFAPGDRSLDPETIDEIAQAVINNLGYGNNQYLVVKHDRYDPKHDRIHSHDHFHILINMVNHEGKRVHDSYDKKKLEKILRAQEQEHNLTLVPSSDQRDYKAATTGQVQRIMREIEECKGRKSTKNPTAPYTLKIHSGIDLASHDCPSLTVFLARLQQLKIDPKLRIESGKVKGISYKLQNFKVKGCKLHQGSFSQLIQNRVTYDPERDMVAINQANQNEEIALAPEFNVSWSQTSLRNYVPNKVQQMLDETFGKQELQVDKKIKKPKPNGHLTGLGKPQTPCPLQNQKGDEGFEIDF